MERSAISTNNIYVKDKKGFIIPVNLVIQPILNSAQGLIFIGLLKPKVKITFQEESFPANEVFTLITNSQNKIYHLTENCLNRLMFSQKYMDGYMSIEEVIPSLVEVLDN